jgi:hypothetical protein
MRGGSRSDAGRLAQHCRGKVPIVSCCVLLVFRGDFVFAVPETGLTNTQDEQSCAALLRLNLQTHPEGPAIITSAQIVDVPAGGLEHVN